MSGKLNLAKKDVCSRLHREDIHRLLETVGDCQRGRIGDRSRLGPHLYHVARAGSEQNQGNCK